MNNKIIIFLLSFVLLVFLWHDVAGDDSEPGNRSIRFEQPMRGGKSREHAAKEYVLAILKKDYRMVWKLLSRNVQQQIDQLVKSGQFASRQVFINAMIEDSLKALQEKFQFDTPSDVLEVEELIEEIVQHILDDQKFVVEEGNCWVISLSSDFEFDLDNDNEPAIPDDENSKLLRAFIEAVLKEDREKVWSMLSPASQENFDKIVEQSGVFIDRESIMLHFIAVLQAGMIDELNIEDISEISGNERLMRRLIASAIDDDVLVEIDGKLYMNFPSPDLDEDSVGESIVPPYVSQRGEEGNDNNQDESKDSDLLDEVDRRFRERQQPEEPHNERRVPPAGKRDESSSQQRNSTPRRNNGSREMKFDGFFEFKLGDAEKRFLQKYVSIILNGDQEALWQCFSPLSQQMIEKMIAGNVYASRQDFLQKYLEEIQKYIITKTDCSDIQDIIKNRELALKAFAAVCKRESIYGVIELNGKYFMSFDPVSEKYNISAEKRALCRQFVMAVSQDDANAVWRLMAPEMQEKVDDFIEIARQYPNRMAFVERFIKNIKKMLATGVQEFDWNKLQNDELSYYKVEALLLYGDDTIFVHSNGQWFVDIMEPVSDQSSREGVAFSLVRIAGKGDADRLKNLFAPDFKKDLSEEELAAESTKLLNVLRDYIIKRQQIAKWSEVLDDSDNCALIAKELIKSGLVEFTEDNGKWFVMPTADGK